MTHPAVPGVREYRGSNTRAALPPHLRDLPYLHGLLRTAEQAYMVGEQQQGDRWLLEAREILGRLTEAL